MVVSHSEVKARAGSRQVWLLAAIGMLAGAISLIVLGFMLMRVETARQRIEETRGELASVVAQSETHLSAGRAQLDMDLSSRTPPDGDSSAWVDALRGVIDRSRLAIQDERFDTTIVDLEAGVEELAVIAADCTNWRRDFAAVLAAMRESRRLADASLAEIREAVAGASGRQRLQRAIQVRRYRNAEGDDIVPLAAAIIDEIESGGSLSAVSVEVADLGLLVEKLVGETNRDELVDLKDNRLVPTFARLRR
ncbi:MAG: hypothetical protein ACYTGR_03440, partial [Planctomycetota bacterium]